MGSLCLVSSCCTPCSACLSPSLPPPAPALPATHAAVEAMRLYVRTLEEELPDWWAHHTGAAAVGNGTEGGEAPAANGVPSAQPADGAQAGAPPQAPPAPKSRSVAEVVVEGSWVSPYISSDKRPPPRYEHATALVGSELFIIGGNYGGWPGVEGVCRQRLEFMTWLRRRWTCALHATCRPTELQRH